MKKQGSPSKSAVKTSRNVPCDTIGIDALEMLKRYAPSVANKVHYRHNLKTGQWQILFTLYRGKGVRVVSDKYDYSKRNGKHMPNPTKAITARVPTNSKNWAHIAGVSLREIKPLTIDETYTLYGFVQASEGQYVVKHIPDYWGEETTKRQVKRKPA